MLDVSIKAPKDVIVIEDTPDTSPGNRIYFLDNLRTFMIFLVVLLHAGLVYESSGIAGFFWIVDDPSTNNLSGIVNLLLDIFVMATIFFVSGFLAPLSLKNKTAWAFLKPKFKRLIIPWIIAVLTLIPLYKVIFLYSRNLPQESWTSYFHWSNGIWSQNWLWFLPVLFSFELLYLLLSRANMTIRAIPVKGVVGAVFLVGFLYSFFMALWGFQGWTKTVLLDFQNERILIYFMSFVLGALCYRQKIFESKWKNKRLYVAVNAVAWVPTSLYLFFIIHSLIRPGNPLFSEMLDSMLTWLSFHLTLLGFLYLMVNTFRSYLDRQGGIWKALGQNSYGVYIIHTVVLGGIALGMLDTAIPSLAKYLTLIVATYIASNLLVYFYRRVIKSLLGFENHGRFQQ